MHYWSLHNHLKFSAIALAICVLFQISLTQAQNSKALIVLTKAVDKTTVAAGDVITYTIHYQNNGSAQASNFVIADVIPTGTSYVPSSANSGGTLDSANTLHWNIGTVNIGTAGSVSFKVTINGSTSSSGSSGSSSSGGTSSGGTGSSGGGTTQGSGSSSGTGSGGTSSGGGSSGGTTSSNALSCGKTPTWQVLTTPFDPTKNFEAHTEVVANDGTIYVGTSTQGIYQSTDHGQSWTSLNNGFPSPLKPVSVLGFNSNGELLAGLNGFSGGSSKGYAYRYVNGAWQQASGIVTNLKVSAFTVDKNGAVIASTAFNGDVYRSTDGGNTYTKIASNIGVASGGTAGAIWVIQKASNGDLFAGGELSNGLLKSIDNGTTWSSIGLSSPTYSGNLTIIQFNKSDEILTNRNLGTIGVTRYSGGLWSGVSGLPSYALIQGMGSNVNGDLFTATQYHADGVYCSSDGGANWRAFNDSHSASDFSSLIVDGTGYVYAFTKGLVVRTQDPTQ